MDDCIGAPLVVGWAENGWKTAGRIREGVRPARLGATETQGKNMIALSTSCRALDHTRGDALVDDLKRLEVPAVELEYRITAGMLHGMRDPLRRSGITVGSIHNYFPLPPDLPRSSAGGDLFLLSHPDKEERRRAVAATLRTIEHAHDLEARAVVLHCGKVEMDADMRTLRGFYKSGAMTSEPAQALLRAKLAELEEKKPPFLDSLLWSLDRLMTAAGKYEVRLGLENRVHYHELPGAEDFETILREFDGGPVGYWHDTGHAHAAEVFGLMPKGGLLGKLSGHLIGVHLHDAVGFRDHLPPGDGEIDFDALWSLLEPHVLRVMELKPGTSEDGIRRGFRFLAEKTAQTAKA